MSNNFCKYLSNQLRVEYGQLRPCCWFTESVDVTHSDKVEQFQKSLDEIVDWKSAKGRCSECFTREKNGLFSPRLASFDRPALTGAKNNDKTSIEIQIDKDCNAACLICGPWNSTTWEKYEHKIKQIPIKNVADPTIASLEFINQLNKSIDFSDAQEVLFLGGEPLRTNSHVRLLENISDPSNIRLKYTTNGSCRPDAKTLEVWSNFKEVVLQLSIDGVGEHFNYLRWPLQWSQVEDNLRYIMSLQPSNIQLAQFSYTTTPFSLFYHDRYEDWANKFFQGTTIDSSKMFARPWQPRGITPMSLSAVPPKLQKDIREKYGAEHSISRILEQFNPAQYMKFAHYIQTHDKHRHTNWVDVFPEMQGYYQSMSSL
jgi:organic radical activating enzyme